MKILKKLIFIFLLLASSSNIKAQADSCEYKYWLTAGLMLSNDISGNFNYSFSLGDNFYKAGYFVRGDFLGGPGEDGYFYHSIDISVGKRIRSEWFQSSLFIGPSFLFGKKKNDYAPNGEFNSFGLQSDLQLLFRLANEVGVGVGLYANLNFENNFAGVNINFTIGNGK